MKGWADKHIEKEPKKKKFLEPNDKALPEGRINPFYYEPSSELATSIGGEGEEPAYLIPSFKYGEPLANPLKEYRETGEHLGGPFKTWQEADEWERTIRHPYVEKHQSLPSPLRRWGKEYRNGGKIAQNGEYIPFKDSEGKKKKISLDEYKKLYESGQIASTYDDKTFSMKDLPEVEIKGEKSGIQRWLDNYATTINRETRSPEDMLLAPMNAMMSLPQLGTVSLFTGKPERPSTALGVSNPIGAIATDMVLDPLNLVGAEFKNPFSGINKLIEERGIGAINPFYYKANLEMMYKSLNQNQVQNMIKRGEIYKNINANSYGKYLPVYNSDGSVEYVYRTFTTPKKEIAQPKIGFIKEDGKFKKIELEKDLSKHDPTSTFVIDRTKKAGDRGRFITLNNYLNRIRAKESATKKIGTSPYVQFTKGAIEKAYAPSLKTSRIPADYVLEVDPSEVGFIKTTKRGQIDPTFEPLTAVGERGMPASVLDDEYLSIDSPGVRILKKDRWHGYREVEKGDLSLRERSLDVVQNVLNKNADILDKKARQVGKNVKKVLPDIPGLTVDDPERGLHALTIDHWVLHPNSEEPSKILYAEAALNRLLPIIKHTPLINPIKRVARQIMSQGAGPSRDKESIINGIKLALFDKNAPLGSYNGTFDPNNTFPDRSLLNLYLYGDEKGFTKANSDILKIDIGERYKKLYPNTEYYLMNSSIPHNEPIHPDYVSGIEENIPKSSHDAGSPVQSLDNIAGHMIEVKNQNGKRTLVTQDLWKFNTKDYGKKWVNGEFQKKQAAILNQLGKPFYLIQNNPIQYKTGGWIDKYQDGGAVLNTAKTGSKIQSNTEIKQDNLGYWNPDNWGHPVSISSGDITMRGVEEPLIGISNIGERKLMEPGKDYKFKGNRVTEYPLYQKGGKLPKDYQKFLDYSKTAPENRRPDSAWKYGNPRQYDHYGMWEALGKPKDFNEARKNNPDWVPDEDGFYHGFSVNPNTGVWLKSHIPGEKEPGNTAWMEYAGFQLSGDKEWNPNKLSVVFNPDLQRLQYIEKYQNGGKLPLHTPSSFTEYAKPKKSRGWISKYTNA